VRTVALIPPCLPAVAASRLGLTNAHLDSDGVIRRAAAGETLGDGSLLQSLPLSTLRTLQPEDWKARVAALDPSAPAPAALIAWRRGEQPYPHVAFADVFQRAEGQAPAHPVPHFAGRIVVIGATAPTLLDAHPTAVSPKQSGVDTLATLIDNELHRRHVAELPGWAQTLLAIALCAAVAWLVRYRSLTMLDSFMLLLPLLLLGITYASLQTDVVFLDLYLATGWALLFMGVLGRWVRWRRRRFM
jgi:CHASE2 domain-containing sensor protein